MPSPHDALFRHTFSRREHATGLLQTILPSHVTRGIDWSTLQAIPGTRIDPELRRHQSDLLFKVRRSGVEVFLYVLIEHKRHGDRWAVFQLLDYVVGLWRDLRKGLSSDQPLPKVLPILIVQSSDVTQPHRLADLFLDEQPCDGDINVGGGVEREAGIDSVQPQFAPHVVYLDACSHQVRESLQMTLLGKLTIDALVQLPGATAEVVRTVLADWSAGLRQLLGTPAGGYDLIALSSYTGAVVDVLGKVLVKIVEENMDPVVREKFLSPKEQWQNESREQGRHEGLDQGRKSGRSHVLLRQLTARFGELPTDVALRLEQATVEELDDWAVRLLDAKSLADVFGN